MKYEELTGKPDLALIQKEVLEFWNRERVFEKSVEQRTGQEVVFYDGPPFPTGKPHHGTVLVSFIKDMIARYWTMRGYRVPRVWGWDCHGLPIENQAETLLGIHDKNEIERSLGIDRFNEKCYEIVSGNNEAWREYVEQMARWVDYDGAYKTMDTDFMESVMWAFKRCYEKGYIYRDYRVTPYCMHCETSLSISDTRESDSTRPRQDRWIIVRFKTPELVQGRQVYLLAWTTTPWTLPSNMCLAVGEQLDYAYVEVGDAVYVACKNTLAGYEKVFGADPVILKECKGRELLGMTYEPLFDYFADKKEQGAFRVVAAGYVGSEEGVGIVHTAPAFGEDDYWTCKENGIPLVNPVDEQGHFTEEVRDFYDPSQEKNVIEMNPAVIRFLYESGKAVADGTIEHNYPHCWRCKRPLIYKAMDAWYFDVGKLKDRLIELNEQINWVPETVKHGRFGNWLAGARDWNISRNRYWSTPIPIWECESCGHRVVLGSIEEIYEASGVRLSNLHRQYMDRITFRCECCQGTMRRVPEVLDCWFESGSVPFAQKHYPFENREWFESHFPSDFIVEYTGQIRCWFYYLHVLSVALFDRPAFQNCVVHGTVLAKDGKKLAKSSRNYTDPMELMKKQGTDAFRLYLYQTNAMLIGDLLFDEAGISDAYQQIILPYWNACNFYISYANIDGFKPGELEEPASGNQLDSWMLAKLYETWQAITGHMDAYCVNRYVEYLASLVDGLTNWYIRRSRRRFWDSGMSADKLSAYRTLYYVLVCTTKLFAPVAPILSEKMYQVLTGEFSVHLALWPQLPQKFADQRLLDDVALAQEVIYLARSIRNKNRVKNRQPLRSLKVALSEPSQSAVLAQFSEIVAEELNVKEVEILNDVGSIAKVQYAPNYSEIRSRYPDRIGELVKAVRSGKLRMEDGSVWLCMDSGEERFEEEIILVTYQAKDGQHVASSRGIVVSLDLNLTQELRDEGLARDIVRNIQDARKQMGCEITDTVLLTFEGDVPGQWIDYICQETLGQLSEIAAAESVLELDTDRGAIKIFMSKNEK
ncbi:MAG: isoleucine--tRNA ligase [bacterium]|nr:isoleucine--tRNA ligase [bacterium]MCM1373535.1 isoleucine--tRNA ligase [Muribaculum sp.]